MTYTFQPRGVCSRAMKAEEAITRLKGINCGGRGTSCPDQFARGLEAAMAQK